MQKSKPKKPKHTKCKHMKRINYLGSHYCVCNSQSRGNAKFNPRYADIIRMLNLFVVGSQACKDAQDNWWKLCVNGFAPFTGITPSKCVFY